MGFGKVFGSISYVLSARKRSYEADKNRNVGFCSLLILTEVKKRTV